MVSENQGRSVHYHCGGAVFSARTRPEHRQGGLEEYIAKLAEVCGCEIKDSAALECARLPHDHFDAAGCRASDHGLDYVIYRPADRAAVDMVFSKG